MQSQNRLLDDIARVTTGALGTLQGVKAELESYFRQQFDKLIGSRELVGREEFDVVKDMVAAARTENERLAARIAELEQAAATPKSARAKPKAEAKPNPHAKPKAKATRKAEAKPKAEARRKAEAKPTKPAKRKAATKRALATEPA